jgi:hypothetical protein
MEITRRCVLLSGAAGAFVPMPADVTTQSLVWDGDPARGTSVFDGLERDPGSITVASDPQGTFGQCFRYQTQDWSNGKERCESRGLRNPDGSVLRLNSSYEGRTLYMGWQALWNVNPNNAWIAVYQLHRGRDAGRTRRRRLGRVLVERRPAEVQQRPDPLPVPHPVG